MERHGRKHHHHHQKQQQQKKPSTCDYVLVFSFPEKYIERLNENHLIRSIQAGHLLSHRVAHVTRAFLQILGLVQTQIWGREPKLNTPLLPSPLLGGFAILNLFSLSSWEHSPICLVPLPAWPIKGSLVLGWGLGGGEGRGPRCCCPGAQPTALAPIPGSSEEVSPSHLACFNLKTFLVCLRTLSSAARK